MMDEALGTFVASAASAISVLVVSRLAKGKLSALEAQLRATDDTKMVRGAVHGTHAGIDYRLRRIDQSSVLISVVCPDLGRLRLSRRRRDDRLGASVFPHTPFTTGDRVFDEQVQVQTRDPVLAKRWLQHADVRRGVLDFAEKIPSFRLDGPRLKHALTLDKFTGEEGIAQLHERVEKLGALVAPLHGPEFRNLPPAAPRRDKAQRVAWALTLGLLLASIAALIVFFVGEAGQNSPRLSPVQLFWLPVFGLALPLTLGPLLASLVSQRSAPWRLLAPQFVLLFFAGLMSTPLALVGINQLVGSGG